MLYPGERENQESCHICNFSLWLTKKKKGAVYKVVEGKKKAAMIFCYFPLIPRLQIIQRRKLHKMKGGMQKKEQLMENIDTRHRADAQAWKKIDSLLPDFKADPRNIRLAF